MLVCSTESCGVHHQPLSTVLTGSLGVAGAGAAASACGERGVRATVVVRPAGPRQAASQGGGWVNPAWLRLFQIREYGLQESLFTSSRRWVGGPPGETKRAGGRERERHETVGDSCEEDSAPVMILEAVWRWVAGPACGAGHGHDRELHGPRPAGAHRRGTPMTWCCIQKFENTH
jgi:hypothetical protein